MHWHLLAFCASSAVLTLCAYMLFVDNGALVRDYRINVSTSQPREEELEQRPKERAERTKMEQKEEQLEPPKMRIVPTNNQPLRQQQRQHQPKGRDVANNGDAATWQKAAEENEAAVQQQLSASVEEETKEETADEEEIEDGAVNWSVHPQNGFTFSDIDCARVLMGDKQYIKKRTKNRFGLQDPVEDERQFPMDCDSIRRRHPQLQKSHKRASQKDAQFPIAFARAVYKDYLFLEMELATNYAPQNWYCFAIDAKAARAFQRRMDALASCFPNVLVAKRSFRMDSSGHNMLNSLLECAHELLAYKWKYLILLQNHDVQLKTNAELVQIFKWLGGANDIQFTPVGSTNLDFGKRDWSLSHLKLFRDDRKNWRLNSSGDPLELAKNKGQLQSSLSRAFVDWMLKELDLTQMLAQLNSYKYGMDEFLFPTLAANEFLEAPGGFTQHCFDRQELAPGLTRLAIWGHKFPKRCRSGIFRHTVCLLGLEDLAHTLAHSPFMFANKMMQSVDAEALLCWHWEMRRRAQETANGLRRLRKELYTQLPQVRYNSLKARHGGQVDLDEFDCHYAFLDQVNFAQEWNGEINH